MPHPFALPLCRRAEWVCVAALASILPLHATAQEVDPTAWSYQISPYLWGASLSGEAGVIPGAPAADVDLSFRDILDDLEIAAMVVGQARKGDWAIQIDLQHVRTKSDGTIDANGFDAAEVDATTQSFSAQLDYLTYQSEGAELWVSGGLRYWNVDTTLTLTGGGNPTTKVRGSDSWWDPVVGLRGRIPLGDASFATGWAYIGGFGAGSDFMTDIFVGAGYEFSETTALVGGLRYQSVDRRDGDFIWDVEQAGPLVGLNIRF